MAENIVNYEEENIKTENIPNYYAILPAKVRYDEKINASEKLLYAEITALCNQEGYCWATNEYFANLYKVSIVTVSNWIKDLVEQDYIYTEIAHVKNSQHSTIRYIFIDEAIKENFKSLSEGIKENFKRGLKENFKHNSTSTNINSTKERKKEKKEAKPTNYDLIIQDNIHNDDVKEAMYDFIKMRNFIKKPMTDRALQNIITKLRRLSKNSSNVAIDILDQSINNNWQDIFELREDKTRIKRESPKESMMDQLNRVYQEMNDE